VAGRGGGKPTEAQLAALEQGRGRRPKEERDHVGMRLDPKVRRAIESLAERHGCLYGGKPQISKLLERIADGELLLVPAAVATPLLESLAAAHSSSQHSDGEAKVVNRELGSGS
jgi:hypothetical protein